MSFQRTHSPLNDWLALTRFSNLPTIVTNSLVGVALVLAIDRAWGVPGVIAMTPVPLTAAPDVALAMCAFYLAGMVLNGIVDRKIDARERPLRPIASGRIALPWAWTVFIILFFFGFFLRPSWGSTPAPVAAAALIGVWLHARANTMRSHILLRLARGWTLVAVIAAFWWVIDLVVREPFDLSAMKEHRRLAIHAGHLAMNLPVLAIAFSLVGYNLLHTGSAYAIGFLALCRACIPIAMVAALLVPHGIVTDILSRADTLGWTSLSMLGTIALCAAALAAHTILLSVVARREVAGHDKVGDSRYFCATCGYALVSLPAATCSECGCDLTTTPPRGERSLRARARFTLPLLALLPLLPLLVIPFVVGTNSSYQGSALPSASLGEFFAGPWHQWSLVSHAMLFISAVWFVIASTRGLSAALSHPSRRPAGIAALIAAFALLDACAAAALNIPPIALACIALWFVTRFAQRRIAGS